MNRGVNSSTFCLKNVSHVLQALMNLEVENEGSLTSCYSIKKVKVTM